MDEQVLKLFSFLSKLEQSAQVRRKVINDYYDYDPAKIFKKLDSENKGYINIDNILSFINNYNIPYTNEAVKLLVMFYDSDFDGILSFHEFLNLIQNNTILIKNKKKIIINNNDGISFNIEYCLIKLIEKEIEINQYIINILSSISNNILDVFNKISSNKKYIRKEDIMNFLNINKIDYTANQIYEIMKRLDIDKDGKIDFTEFNYLFESVKPEINNNDIYIKNINYDINKINTATRALNNDNDDNIQNGEFVDNENDKNNYNINNIIYQTPITKDINNDNKNIYSSSTPSYNCINNNNERNENNIENREEDHSFNNNNNDYNECNYNKKKINSSYLNDNYNSLNNNDNNNNNYNDDMNNLNCEDINNSYNYSNVLTTKSKTPNSISNTLSLRTSPIRKYPPKGKNHRNCNTKNNNINNKQSYKIQNNNNNYFYKTAHSTFYNEPNNNRNNKNFSFCKTNYSQTYNNQNSYNNNNNYEQKGEFNFDTIINKINNNSNTNNDELDYATINNNNNNYIQQNEYSSEQKNKNDNKTINSNNNTNSTSIYNFEYNKPITRVYSLKNLPINKNNFINNGINDMYLNTQNKKLTKNKKILSKYFKIIMQGESQIELKKINLITRKDFNFENAFNLFDEQNKGYITFDDMKNELEFIGLTLKDTDIQLLMNRFSINNENNEIYIEFQDFCEGIFPCLSGSDNISNENNDNNNMNVFTPTTRLYFRALFKAMIDLENKLNKYKREKMDNNINNNVNNIIEVLKEIDVGEKGFFDLNELIRFLKENSVYTSLKDAKLLFSRFDKNKNGKVSNENLISDLCNFN